MRQPKTLFARTALTLAIAFALLLLTGAIIFNRFVMAPTAKQASEDAAALLVLSAQTWAELPPQTRADFEYELQYSHNIHLTESDVDDAAVSQEQTYPEFLTPLKTALENRLGENIALRPSSTESNWFEVDLPVAGRTLRLSFPREHFDPGKPYILFWLILATALATLATTLLLVRHLTRPLQRLSQATVSFGRGESLPPLPESGPQELQNLTRSFNQMTTQLQELLANRTTLLAGISHDLRTPIARLSLALEMLPQDADPTLLQSMHKDLKEMDELIARTLLLARNMDDSLIENDEVNVPELLDGIITELRSQAPDLVWQPHSHCWLETNTVALRRVVTNLLENALRYAEKAPELVYQCDDKTLVIEVLDHGPGIPPEKLKTVFQPFYRLESSRNTATGGSGLGLAIVQQLCHANGWDIQLNNRMEGGLRARLTIRR